MYNIYPCSEKAKLKIVTYVDTVGTNKYSEETWDDVKNIYPWRFLYIGESFAVPFANCSEITLRTKVFKKGKTLGKKFAVIKHNEHCVYEVARIG